MRTGFLQDRVQTKTGGVQEMQGAILRKSETGPMYWERIHASFAIAASFLRSLDPLISLISRSAV